MRWTRVLLPALLAGGLIVGALLFVRWFDAYEAPGEHWAPASPTVHERARFMTDMGTGGDYRVQVEKLASKFPPLFVEYQTPGPILDATVHSDDGIVRLEQAFADEGAYRITVQCLDHPEHREVIDFTVQTPLSKYAVDGLLILLLFAAGYASGRRLRALAAAVLLLAGVGMAAPADAWAHGGHGHAARPGGARADALTLDWLSGHAPHGVANRSPMDWGVRLMRAGAPVEAHYALDVVHLETGLPVLHIEGRTVHGTIPLRYSPPDGTTYRLVVRAIAGGREHHLAIEGAADALRPTAARQWLSFALLMAPALLGMAWGWWRGAGASRHA